MSLSWAQNIFVLTNIKIPLFYFFTQHKVKGIAPKETTFLLIPIIINTTSRTDNFFDRLRKFFFDRLLEIDSCNLLLEAAHKLNVGDDSFRSTVNNTIL